MNLKKAAFKQAMNMKTLPLKGASPVRRIAAFLYLLIGRKGLGKLYYINKKCGDCRMCMRVCPNAAVSMRFNSPFWSFKCKGCLVCAAACPGRSIEISVLKLLLIIVLIFLPYDGWLEKLFQFRLADMFGQIPGLGISLVIWGAGYAASLFLMDRLLTILFSFQPVKNFMNLPLLKKFRDEINPLAVFPVIITQKAAENLSKEGFEVRMPPPVENPRQEP